MYGPLVGRVLLALIFIISGFAKLTGFAGTVGLYPIGRPACPQLGAVIAIIVELGGGIMLVIGWKARWAAPRCSSSLYSPRFLPRLLGVSADRR